MRAPLYHLVLWLTAPYWIYVGWRVDRADRRADRQAVEKQAAALKSCDVRDAGGVARELVELRRSRSRRRLSGTLGRGHRFRHFLRRSRRD